MAPPAVAPPVVVAPGASAAGPFCGVAATLGVGCAGAVAEAEAREQGLTLEAHYAHLLVHGTLHAQGYEHDGVPEADAVAMEARETTILAGLAVPDPYSR